MTDRTTGRFALLRQLIADGIPCLFGNPGSSEENLLDALQDPEFASLRYYLGLQEACVVGMADAYARASPPRLLPGDLRPWRRPAVVQLHSYAGLANGLGMIYGAKRGGTPMVVIAGEAGLAYEALDGQMAADLTAIARPFVKSDHNGPCAWRVVDERSLLRLVRRAVKTAATPPCGPVFLSLPMDVLDRPVPDPVVRTLPVASRVLPDGDTLRAAARLLADAARPLILIGDGIAASGAQGELSELALRVGATVWGGNDSEVNIAASHPLYRGPLDHMFGEANRARLAEADVVLVCGTTLFPEVFPVPDAVFAAGAKLIHIDLDAAEIGKTHPVTIGALGDPKLTLAALAEELTGLIDGPRREAIRDRRDRLRRETAAAREAALARDAAAEARGGLTLSRFARALAARLPPDALIFDEALTSSPELMRHLPRDEPGHYFQTRSGMLGTGLPGAIGLKVAQPERTVVGFCGDGGGISTIQALATAARYDIGAKIVVCNNRSYRILELNLREYRRGLGLPPDAPFPESFDLAEPALRFDRLAQAQGVNAVRVDAPEQIEPALDAAFADPGAPFLIELILDPALS